ncbi:MAG: response regulator [Acidobacteria bacterium]|nr:response regulator [Acidobacteriota bacterium]
MPEATAATVRTTVVSEVESLRRRVEDLEGQLSQTQKLLAIGSLAGGVAHDFNNLLTAILGYASLLREDPTASVQVMEALDVIEKAAERASQLTAQILGFARRGHAKRARVDVRQTLNEVADLLRHTVDKNIRLDVQLDGAPAYVMGDSSQLFQVFLNLALNGRDAMPDGGTLTLAAKSTASGVQVTVGDSGSGIPAQIRERVFEPFFTTKDPGKGTGMGLTVVQSIVRGHSGRIEIECDPPPGTRFQLIFPPARERTAVVAETVAAAPARGKGAVLVVDDEEVVRQVAARMLKSLGYHAICLGSSRDAFDYYRRRAHDIDLVILDLIMPDISGKELFEQLREFNPCVRVLLTSGYNQDASVDTLIDSGARGFLQKPYRMAQLSQSLTAAMKA